MKKRSKRKRNRKIEKENLIVSQIISLKFSWRGRELVTTTAKKPTTTTTTTDVEEGGGDEIKAETKLYGSLLS